MDDISNELNTKINREVMIKDALVSAREEVKRKRPITRSKIEDLKELAQLEDNWMNDD